jgi:hypothetical protein
MFGGNKIIRGIEFQASRGVENHKKIVQAA